MDGFPIADLKRSSFDSMSTYSVCRPRKLGDAVQLHTYKFINIHINSISLFAIRDVETFRCHVREKCPLSAAEITRSLDDFCNVALFPTAGFLKSDHYWSAAAAGVAEH